MSTSAYLATFGVTLEQARAFVTANLANPQVIFNTALQYGVTNQMLGEIAGNYTADDVRAFFNAKGFDSGALDDNYAVQILPPGLGLESIMALNANTGTLSTASLAARVGATTGTAAYNAAFDPSNYVGAFDGTLAPEDLGFSQLGTLPATSDTLQSLFFGSVINGLRQVDQQEAQQFQAFVSANRGALKSGNADVFADYVDLMQGIMADPATPWIDDASMAQLATAAGVYYVQLIAADHDIALVDGLLGAFI